MRNRDSTKTLAPAPAGQADFWATVHVKFLVPMRDADHPDATPTQGYYRNFGIRALPERVQLVLAEAVLDGTVEWEETEWELVDPDRLGKAVRACIEPVIGEGVWYKSACVLYADPDLEPSPG